MLDNAVHVFCIVLSLIEREATKSLTMSVGVSLFPFMSIFFSCIYHYEMSLFISGNSPYLDINIGLFC